MVINKFYEIKDIRIPTSRHGDQMLGNAFEDMMNVKENNSTSADFHGIELKTKKNSARAMITLFTATPENKENSNTSLLSLYGYDEFNRGIKKLNSSVTVKGTTNKKANKFFYLELDKINRKLYLRIKENKNSSTNLSFYQVWDFNTFDNAIKNKLDSIAYVSGTAEETTDSGDNYITIHQLEFFKGLSTKKIIEAIEKNHIKLDLRLGVFESGKNIGKYHDHGTGFRISYKNLIKYVDVDLYI